MELTPYHPDQAEEIITLFTHVFAAADGEAEGALIGNLASDLMTETDPADLYGFVAVEAGKILGCIFFSRLTFDTGIPAFILSPVAVHTGHQRRGIGQQLIKYGLRQLKDVGVELVMSYGDPNYYARVGFAPVSEETIQAPLPLSHPGGWIGQSLVGESIAPIADRPTCVKALIKPEIW
jgi:putative acetyltransferase